VFRIFMDDAEEFHGIRKTERDVAISTAFFHTEH